MTSSLLVNDQTYYRQEIYKLNNIQLIPLYIVTINIPLTWNTNWLNEEYDSII